MLTNERDEELKQDERYFVKIHAPFEVLLVLVRDIKNFVTEIDFFVLLGRKIES